jgi:hypothetical protein
MCVDDDVTVSGYTTAQIRDLLRRIGNRIWHKLDFPLRLDLSFREACSLADALVECGLLERVSGWRGQGGRSSGFQLTALGRGVTGLSRLQPISRRRADALIAKVIARIAAINSRPDLSYRIAEAHVIGSWCSGEAEVTIVEVAARLELRDDPVGRTRQKLARDDETARTLAYFLRQEFDEVMAFLRARTPHLRVYACEKSSRLGARKQRIYPPPDPDTSPSGADAAGSSRRGLVRKRGLRRKPTRR